MKNSVSLGILLTTLAYMAFTFHDAIIKVLASTIPVWQILFFRSLTILVGCLAYGRGKLVRQTMRSPIIKPMIARSILLLCAWLSYYSAASRLQLAEVTTLYYAAPVVGTLLAWFILKEKVTPARWLAVGVGFVGVLIACNPIGLTISWPVYLALQAAVLWACAMVLLRKTSLHEKTIIQLAVSNVFFLAMTGVAVIWTWRTPDMTQLALLIATGVVAGCAQFALFEGMRQAPVSVLAPFEYSSLIWAFLLGYLIWADIPTPNVVVGAAMILGAGLIIIVSEKLRRRITA
ncbi:MULTISPECIES: DMT family transporter [Rhizobium]|uniref:Transmembrane protein n=2 Tax=Rhizobium TaxID=379 RepID=Q1MAC2_RHIJ3|nr:MULTISPECIES: DMT family transporter [Rhizobium]MBB4508829.1 drug/metabolite transporter (DMT)-like permease [Rhizobium leguminosarum]MBY5322389.1 DMT family transporter [Rhizobium leguminosarum]MBY5343213.1 DMT family transporter [Rhizobium leguminosarum]MBY5377624.1 DMT family transporter [Rhizobium leguminosarum]MBY5383670.1 DMT family transporter [Rhizobium leguminosarum]